MRLPAPCFCFEPRCELCAAHETLLPPAAFAARMRVIALHPEQERRHEDADALLCAVLTALGYGEGVQVFEAMAKWYA